MLTVQVLYARRSGELTRATLLSFIMSAVVLLAAVWKRTFHVCVNPSATTSRTGIAQSGRAQSGIPLELSVNDFSTTDEQFRDREENAFLKKRNSELLQLLREQNVNVEGACVEAAPHR